MTEPLHRKLWQYTIENVSENQISEYFHRLGWVVVRLEKDYGEDFFIRIFEKGTFTGKAFYVQLKGTNNIQQYALKTNVFSYKIEVEGLLHWHCNQLPVIFVLWDVEQRRGYWLHIQSYIDKKLKEDPTWLEHKKAKEKRNIHIPVAQTLPCDEENTLLALMNADPPLRKMLDGAVQIVNDSDNQHRLDDHLTSTGTRITAVESYPEAASAVTSPVPIFCAAAPEDHILLAQWTNHLSPLQAAGHISIWSEAYILSGKSRDTLVENYLSTVKIVVFLLSADFFADHKCLKVLTQALSRARLGYTRIIPLLLRATSLDETLLGGLAYLPTNGRPVANWSNRDDAFQNCVYGLKQVLAELQSNDAH